MEELKRKILNSKFLFAALPVPVPRREWQDKFDELQEAAEISSAESWSLPLENETFYYLLEAESNPLEVVASTVSYNNTTIPYGQLPVQFLFKPTGYQLTWYKYPLRGAYSNQDVPFEGFCNMVDLCLQSIADDPLHIALKEQQH